MFDFSAVALVPFGTYTEGTRVVVNDGTGRKPHYFVGTVVKEGGRVITIHLDKGETRTLVPTKSNVGLVGLWYKPGNNTKEISPAHVRTGMNPNVRRTPQPSLSPSNRRPRGKVKAPKGKVRHVEDVPSPVPANPMKFIGEIAERLFSKEITLDEVLEKHDALLRENPSLLRALTNRVKLLQREEEDRLPKHLRRGYHGEMPDSRTRKRSSAPTDFGEDPLSDSFDGDDEGYSDDDYL